MASPQTLCLLVGFDSFGKHKTNPSQVLVEASPDILKTEPTKDSKSAKEIHISKIVLPTDGDKAWEQLKKQLDLLNAKEKVKKGKAAKSAKAPKSEDKSKEPVILLITGFSQRAERLQLERIALNIKDYRIPDNSGKQVFDEPVATKAPLAMRTEIDLRELAKGLNSDGYPADVSNHAGTFICNELYFQALHYIEKDEAAGKKFAGCLFVHVPEAKTFANSAVALKKSPLKKEAKAALKDKELRNDFLRDGVLRIVEHLAHKLI